MDIFGPGATMPGAAALSATMLGATGLGAATPGATTPGATTPGATTPGATTPGATTPGATTSGAQTSGVTSAPPSADPDAPLDPKIWQAAQSFEAMAIGQMLAPMFDTVDLSKSKFGGGQGEAAWQPMMINAIGKQMEAHGGFGLAQPIYAAMLRAQEGHAQQEPAQAGRTPGAPAQPSLRHAAHQPGKSP
jgi:peptidoglycan hydrolase FlgJ